MDIEAGLIDRINASPDDRLPQLVYADWLEERGDPRGEAWRVLVEEGKRPDYQGGAWDWWWRGSRCYNLEDLLPIKSWHEDGLYSVISGSETFFSAMNLAAIAWVRAYRNPDYEPTTDSVSC